MTSSIMLFLIQVRTHPGKLLKYMIDFFFKYKKIPLVSVSVFVNI